MHKNMTYCSICDTYIPSKKFKKHLKDVHSMTIETYAKNVSIYKDPHICRFSKKPTAISRIGRGYNQFYNRAIIRVYHNIQNEDIFSIEGYENYRNFKYYIEHHNNMCPSEYALYELKSFDTLNLSIIKFPLNRDQCKILFYNSSNNIQIELVSLHNRYFPSFHKNRIILLHKNNCKLIQIHTEVASKYPEQVIQKLKNVMKNTEYNHFPILPTNEKCSTIHDMLPKTYIISNNNYKELL